MTHNADKLYYSVQQTTEYLSEQGKDLDEREEKEVAVSDIQPGKRVEFPCYGGAWQHFGLWSVFVNRDTIRIRRRPERELLLESLQDMKTETWKTLPTETLRSMNALLWERQAPTPYALAVTSMNAGQSITLIPSFRFDEKRGYFAAPIQKDGRARTLYVSKARMQRAIVEMLARPVPRLEDLFNPYSWQPDDTQDILLTSSTSTLEM